MASFNLIVDPRGIFPCPIPSFIPIKIVGQPPRADQVIFSTTRGWGERTREPSPWPHSDVVGG
jgi:hypothetical protein